MKHHHCTNRILQIFQQKVKGEMVGSWFTQGRLVCRCSHSLRVVPSSCWLNCCCCSGKLLGLWVWWEGCCSKLSPWRDEKHSEALNANAVEQVRAARTMAAIELCRRKLALVSQLSTCHCYCQREGDERNRLQQQKIQFIKKKTNPTKQQQQNNPGELPVLNVLSNLAWRKKCDM